MRSLCLFRENKHLLRSFSLFSNDQTDFGGNSYKQKNFVKIRPNHRRVGATNSVCITDTVYGFST